MRKSGNIPGQSMRLNLTRRFISILVFGAGIAIVSSALFAYYHARHMRREGAGAAMQRVTEGLADQIDISLQSAVQSLIQLAASPEIANAVVEQNKKYEGLSPSEINELVLQEIAIWKASKQPEHLLESLQANRAAKVLAGFVSRDPSFLTVKAVDRAGSVVAAVGHLDSPGASQESWWQQADASGQITIYEPVLTENPVRAQVGISLPILSAESGDIQGRLYAEYGLGRIASDAGDDKQEIVGFLLAENDERRLYLLAPPDLASPRPTEFSLEEDDIELLRREGSLLRLTKRGIGAIAGLSPISNSLPTLHAVYKGRKWSAVAAIPEDEVLGPLNSLFFRALTFSAAVLILLSLGGLAFARRVLRPIRVLQQGVHEIGRGNLEHRIDVRSGDEIELLASEFNRMADRMQRTQEQLQRHSKELEQKVNQLRRLQAQLMQSERMAATGELAAQIAHEINNPLGIIKNYVGIAKLLMPEEDPNRENMKIVDQEINRIAGIVRRLLKFAKPGAEDIQSVQINQILEELLALLRGQLFRRKIEISAELAESLPEVSVSTDQIRQVFLNLIKNAEDAMPEGGKLTIRTRYRKGRVEIDVADDGCGIPAGDIKNIFEPFFTTKGVKGTGLGLSVSYGIIKNYSGEISVDSEPGRGTTFTIQLPVVSDKVFQVIQST